MAQPGSDPYKGERRDGEVPFDILTVKSRRYDPPAAATY
jgi:hypothetical protein